MTEYIERVKIATALRLWKNRILEQYGENDEYVKCLDTVLRGIDSIPAADARPMVRGKWKRVDDYRYPWGCSNCRTTFGRRYNFCPNCGADMR